MLVKRVIIIMSSYNNPGSHNNGLGTSMMGFPSSSSFKKTSFPTNPFLPTRQFTEYSSSGGVSPHRPMLTQSVICAPRSDGKPKFEGLSKLDSMARHVNTCQNQDLPCQKHNSAQKTPFSRAQFPSNNTFTTQITFPKSPNVHPKQEEEKRICTEPSNPKAKRRRQSMDLENLPKKEGIYSDKLKFMRNVPFQPLSSNQEKKIEKNDCESTNSGSGAEMMKPKNFDFLKKKKDVKEDKQSLGGGCSKSVKVFQPFKKSEIIWPLSISPMEQKMQKTFDYSSLTASSGNKSTNQDQNPNIQSSVQFKKKKLFQTSVTPPFKNQQNKNEQYSRFCPKALTPESKLEQIPFFKSKLSKPRKEFSIEDFEILNKLGKGAFGEVFVAQEKLLGLVCVIKKMSKKRIKEANVEQHIIREIKLQSYLNNSHLTSLYGYFHDQDYLYLILELLPDGSLQQVKKKRKLPQKEAADILRQVALGLKSMHQEYVIHRDLKPENLFLNQVSYLLSQGYVKIGDFGCSIYHNQVGLRNTIVGCLEYSSPQQLLQEGYTDKIDSWSLGIMTFELLFGKSPFESDIKKMVINKEGIPNLSQVIFPFAPPISQQAKEFILNLLDCNPDKRMDMDEVLAHPFIKEQK